MKRINNIFQQIISIENLELADNNARKGKRNQYGVIRHDKTRVQNINDLHILLKSKIKQVDEKDFPFTATIVRKDDRLEFN